MITAQSRLTRGESQSVTRRKLLEAAREIILRDGLSAASVRSISDEAGFSQGAFYSNFESKAHFLVEVLSLHLSSVNDRLDEMADAVEETPVDPDRSSPAAVTDFFRSLHPKLNFATLAVELWLHANQDEDMAERYGAMRTKYFARAGNAFRRVFDHLGLAPRISPEELAMGLTSTTVGFAIQSGGPMGSKAREEFMSAVFEGILFTAEAAE